MNSLKNLVAIVYGGIMGAIIGFLSWLFLLLVTDGIHLFWDNFIFKQNSKILILIVCLIGGILVGICSKYIGKYPKTMEIVLGEYKRDKRVEYRDLPKSIVKVFTVLWFGGTVGPEAALTGILGGGSTFVGELLKYGIKREKHEKIELRSLKDKIFEVPLYGFYNFINEDNEMERKKYKKRLYSITVAIGIIVFFILAKIDDKVSFITKLPKVIIDKKSMELIFVIFLIGVFMILYYMVLGKLIEKIFKPLGKFKILSAVIGGIILGILAISIPYIVFSGEHSLRELVDSNARYGAGIFLAIGLFKLLSLKICIQTGWIGGPIFPIIFSAAAIGIFLSKVLGVNESFSIAILMSTMVSGALKNFKLSTILVIWFFSINIWIPIAVVGFLSEKIFKKISSLKVFREVE
ncbi:MAG: chloride channel protein [Clostridium sp.]